MEGYRHGLEKEKEWLVVSWLAMNSMISLHQINGFFKLLAPFCKKKRHIHVQLDV
jgi:hypothetical protein